MHFAVFDHVVPAVQHELAGLDALAHHWVGHQPFELQHHRALLGAPQRLGCQLDRQRCLAPEL